GCIRLIRSSPQVSTVNLLSRSTEDLDGWVECRCRPECLVCLKGQAATDDSNMIQSVGVWVGGCGLSDFTVSCLRIIEFRVRSSVHIFSRRHVRQDSVCGERQNKQA